MALLLNFALSRIGNRGFEPQLMLDSLPTVNERFHKLLGSPIFSGLVIPQHPEAMIGAIYSAVKVFLQQGHNHRVRIEIDHFLVESLGPPGTRCGKVHLELDGNFACRPY